uniref:Uncharacterized protein n=1 Tax=Oryza glaberrima TaxID=4538 RepID=I1R6E8_ORYGL
MPLVFEGVIMIQEWCTVVSCLCEGYCHDFPLCSAVVVLRGMATCVESCLVGTVVHLWPE